MDRMYLENIDEFLNDENRIVTYRWLSLTLSVSSNIAKQMLYHYYEKHKTNDSKCTASYLVSGLKYDETLKQDCREVCIVNEDDLEKAKEKFKEIFSVHLYSIQKSRLKDLNVLYATDYDKIRENALSTAKYSAICCLSAKLKSSTEEKKDSKDSLKLLINDKDVRKTVVKEEEEIENKNKENVKGASNAKAGPVGGIASMFANQRKNENTKSSLETKVLVASSNSSKAISKPVSKTLKKGSIASFFSKSNSFSNSDKKPAISEAPPIKTEPVKKEIKLELKSENKEEEKDDMEVKEFENEGTNISKVEEKSYNKNSKYKKSTRSKPGGGAALKLKRKSSEMNRSKDSKRRRILAVDSSSDSSSEEEELREESPIPSPEAPPTRAIESDDEMEELIAPTPDGNAETDKRTKRRVKKLIDKTFVNDEGFLVTDKEYEFVTDSENEENPIPPPKLQSATDIKPPSSPKTKEQTKPAPKTKQSSIMSFMKMKS